MAGRTFVKSWAKAKGAGSLAVLTVVIGSIWIVFIGTCCNACGVIRVINDTSHVPAGLAIGRVGCARFAALVAWFALVSLVDWVVKVAAVTRALILPHYLVEICHRRISIRHIGAGRAFVQPTPIAGQAS